MKTKLFGVLLCIAACEDNCPADDRHTLACLAACGQHGVQSISYTKCVCQNKVVRDGGQP